MDWKKIPTGRNTQLDKTRPRRDSNRTTPPRPQRPKPRRRRPPPSPMERNRKRKTTATRRDDHMKQKPTEKNRGQPRQQSGGKLNDRTRDHKKRKHGKRPKTKTAQTTDQHPQRRKAPLGDTGRTRERQAGSARREGTPVGGEGA